MSNFWEAQRAADAAAMWNAAGSAIADNFARRDAKRAAADAAQRTARMTVELDARYQEAIARAEQTGERLPDELQKIVPVDELVIQTVLKNAALRELQRLAPAHPLLKQEVREQVAKEGLRIFNRAQRPILTESYNASHMTPDEKTTAEIFAKLT